MMKLKANYYVVGGVLLAIFFVVVVWLVAGTRNYILLRADLEDSGHYETICDPPADTSNDQDCTTQTVCDSDNATSFNAKNSRPLASNRSLWTAADTQVQFPTTWYDVLMEPVTPWTDTPPNTTFPIKINTPTPVQNSMFCKTVTTCVPKTPPPLINCVTRWVGPLFWLGVINDTVQNEINPPQYNPRQDNPGGLPPGT